MKYLLFALAMLSSTALAFEPSILQGQWAAHQQRETGEDRYFFLSVNADLSGVLVRTQGGETIERRFDVEDTMSREAYLEADLAEGETVILWAWKQNNGVRRVNGLLFEKGRQEPVRNMLPVPLEYLGPDHELHLDPRIRAWITRYPYHGASGEDEDGTTLIPYRVDPEAGR